MSSITKNTLLHEHSALSEELRDKVKEVEILQEKVAAIETLLRLNHKWKKSEPQSWNTGEFVKIAGNQWLTLFQSGDEVTTRMFSDWVKSEVDDSIEDRKMRNLVGSTFVVLIQKNLIKEIKAGAGRTPALYKRV